MNLIAILLMIFAVFAFVQVVYTFTYTKQGSTRYHDEVFPWIALPANLGTLASRPWTLLTHPFIHDDIWRVVSNLLWLWAFGYIYQDFTGYRKLIPLFLYGSLAGALCFVAAYNLLPGLTPGTAIAFGASPGVMAIAVATTVQAPRFRIFPMLNGGIPLWVLTVIYVIIVFASIPINRTPEHLAHLGAAVLGYIFQAQQQRGRDWATPLNRFWDWVTNLFNPDRHGKERIPKDELFYKASVPPYQKKPNYTQQRVDEILDKINQKGFKSLTEEEREILRRASSDGNV
ncbi:rhomboid family intramembrane serine protease [Flaviaesturariibacter amylovorans]|uniref:Rhomboid family intramembrane serine protease n=2 Tax=Flaviaesturariibacter amylovorans TaxID=1084520 RepID=A0ABP8HUI4_9BACT